MKQSEFDFTGEQLRDTGIQMAVDHAGDNWKETTWNLFKEFLKDQKEPFLIEEFRSFCAMKDNYQFPPSNRAYGFISVKAVKNGLIKQIGTKKVSNNKAHCANAALWVNIS